MRAAGAARAQAPVRVAGCHTLLFARHFKRHSELLVESKSETNGGEKRNRDEAPNKTEVMHDIWFPANPETNHLSMFQAPTR